MKLITLEDLKRFRVAHTAYSHTYSLPDEPHQISCLDFHRNGEIAAYASFNPTNSSLFVLKIDHEVKEPGNYKMKEANQNLKFKFMKGAGYQLVHTSSHASSDWLRLMDIERNGYVQYLPGHTKEVISLDTSARLIASGSNDSSVRLWDPRQRNHVAMKAFQSSPLVALHHSLIAVAYNAYNSYAIEIFDGNMSESLKKIHSDAVPDAVQWMELKFSPNGKLLMVTTNSTYILIFDARKGEEAFKLTGFSNPAREAFEACFTPDSRFVLGGSKDGQIHIWNLKDSGFLAYSLRNPHRGTSYNLAVNPKYMNLISSSNKTNVHLWIEKIDL